MPGRFTRFTPGVVALAVGAVLLCGCGSSAGGPSGTSGTNSDNEAGGPLPNQRDGETYPGTRSDVVGQVLLTDNGCLYVVVDGVRRFAVWPVDAAQDKDDATAVRLADGARIHPGDAVKGSATVMPVSSLAGMPDGYWGQQVTFCAPSDSDVLVLDTVAVSS